MLITAKYLKQAEITDEALDEGAKIELEHKSTIDWIIEQVKAGHTPSLEIITQKIAGDHLGEDPEYYTKLKKYIENGTSIEKTSSFVVVSFIVHLPGHKGSDGKEKPWVIKSHTTKKILGSYGSRAEAEKALKRMHYFKHQGALVDLRKFGSLDKSYRKAALKTNFGIGE
jgi:hypothetical protein